MVQVSLFTSFQSFSHVLSYLYVFCHRHFVCTNQCLFRQLPKVVRSCLMSNCNFRLCTYITISYYTIYIFYLAFTVKTGFTDMMHSFSNLIIIIHNTLKGNTQQDNDPYCILNVHVPHTSVVLVRACSFSFNLVLFSKITHYF